MKFLVFFMSSRIPSLFPAGLGMKKSTTVMGFDKGSQDKTRQDKKEG
jgi:hypothetical protein